MNYSPNAQRTNNVHFASNRDLPMGISPLPANPVVAMAYVPFQTDTATYDEINALACGTLFPCLNKPFKGCGAK